MNEVTRDVDLATWLIMQGRDVKIKVMTNGYLEFTIPDYDPAWEVEFMKTNIPKFIRTKDRLMRMRGSR